MYALVKYMYFGRNLAMNKNPAIQTYYTALFIEEHEAFWSLYSQLHQRDMSQLAMYLSYDPIMRIF